MRARICPGLAPGVVLLLAAAGLAQPAKDAKLPAESVVTHPVVAGFERFHADDNSDAATGGRLLLGDLNCVACHDSETVKRNSAKVKQAPILDTVGARVRVSFLRSYLSAPQKAKPGTTMPDVFAGLPEAERTERVEALVHFLASTGSMIDTASQSKDVKDGEQHFHRLGCVACHAPRKDPPALLEPRRTDDEDEDKPKTIAPPTIIPLGDLPAKYTLGSLTRFLKDPLAVRPSGRMPGLHLDDGESRAIASYFFRDHQVPPNVNYAWYEGHWDNVPDFSKLTPRTTGQTSGFDLSVTQHPNDFGIRFTGFLQVPQDGDYEFWLGSDDGSQLRVDGRLVASNDGIHPHSEKQGKTRLTKGPHPIQVDYIQGGGEWTLALDIAGPNLPRQPAAIHVTPKAEVPKPASEPGKAEFVLKPELVEKGKQVFATSGCAKCHTLRLGGQPIADAAGNLPLTDMTADCLSEKPSSPKGDRPVPFFGFTPRQRRAVTVALKSASIPQLADRLIDESMAQLNCYACHTRGERGGVEPQRNAYFETLIKEMGDEGRLPPPLNGAGDKLQEGYLNQLVQNGAKDRQYMLARMPRFGAAAGDLAQAFARVDAKTEAKLPDLKESPAKLKSIGRALMGDKGLSCAKCHPFNHYAEPGIQALKLNLMAGRLREDWFYRYLIDPQTYRPGTRMPGFFPGGRSANKDILGGDPAAQMRAMWTWLSDGDRAAVPSGLIRDAIVLTPTSEPIVYRNFIEGLSPRGIAVGYPEQVNLAFDAERFTLAMIWQGQFIDASKHWVGRGPGFQGPLGDNIVAFPAEPPFAVLASANDAWPGKPAKEQGYKFQGYRLDKERRPTFQYTATGAAVADFFKPVKSNGTAHFERTLTMHPASGTLPPENVYFRVAAGKAAAGPDGKFTLDSGLSLIVRSNGSKPAFVRPAGDRQEIVVPLEFVNGVSKIDVKYEW